MNYLFLKFERTFVGISEEILKIFVLDIFRITLGIYNLNSSEKLLEFLNEILCRVPRVLTDGIFGGRNGKGH